MAISMGAMLAGVFVLPGLAVVYSGPALPLAYLLAAMVVLPAALAKCELATALPRSGGTYLYVERGIGPLAGTIVGLGVWFSLSFKAAFSLVGLGAYLTLLFKLAPDKLTLFGLVICFGLTVVNLLGVKKSSRLQNFIVGLSLLGLFLFVALSMPKVEVARFEGLFQKGAWSFISAAGLVMVSFAGVTKIASIAEEVQEPHKNLPRGILASLLLVAAIKTLITVALVGTLDWSKWGGLDKMTPLTDVGTVVLGPAAGGAIAVIAVLTLTSMANSGLLTASRYPLAMSRDKLAPDLFSRINPNLRTPIPAIVITSVLMMSLIALVPVLELAKLASAFKLLVFAVVCLSIIVLRESGARWYKPSFRLPGYPIVPLLGMVGCLVLLVTMGRIAWIGAGGIITAGILWYFVYARRRVSHQGAVSRLYGERRRISRRVPRPVRPSGVTIAIFERDEAIETLIPLGGMLADTDCQLQVVRIEEVPDQASLGLFADEDPQTLSIADHVERVAEARSLSVWFEDVVTHHAKHVLYQKAVGEETNWIVMRWQPRSPWRVFVPDPVAWFIHHPPCNLLLFRDASDSAEDAKLEDFKKVLVLAEPGPHDALVVHVADRLAASSGAGLTFIYLAPAAAADDDVQGLLAYHEGLEKLSGHEVGEPKVIKTSDDMATVLEECKAYDLLVIGAPPESEVRGALRGSFEDQVTENAPCAVLRVNAVRGKPHQSIHRPSRASQLSNVSDVLPTLPHDPEFTITQFLDVVEVSRGAKLTTKAALFKAIGNRFQERHPSPLAKPVETALWERERKQVTALDHGVAIPHVSLNDLDRIYVEVWVLDPPVDFKAGPKEEPIDVCFVVLGPPGKRRTHLRVLARIGELVLLPEFLGRLRAAKTADEARDVIRISEKSLEKLRSEGSGPPPPGAPPGPGA